MKRSYIKKLLEDLKDDRECSFDHHGYCSIHGWTNPGVCPQFRLKTLLAIWEDVDGQDDKEKE